MRRAAEAEGRSIPYQLILTDVKRLTLRVKEDGEPVVRAPRGTCPGDCDRFVLSQWDWIRERQARVSPASPEETARLIRLAEAILPVRTAHYARQMGVSPTAIVIKDVRSRFGSCSSTGRIMFSCRLMAYPLEAIDYVVVHELAHLRFMDHQAGFHALVAEILPDWEARRALLRQ